MPASHPELSIVIATYNRAASLLRTLESLAGQTLAAERWDAVVVDNNSTDDTRAVFLKFASGHPNLQLALIAEIRQGLSHARNAGIAQSTGRYIAVIDDDETVNPEFAEAYLAFFEAFPQAAGAGGKVVPVYETPPPRWFTPLAGRPITGELDLGGRIKLFPAGKYPPGGNMGVRREALERYGVFNTELGRTGDNLLGGEEKDLFERLRAGGEAIYYLPGAVIYHHIPPAKLTTSYFDRVNRMVGRSERVRTLARGRGAYLGRLVLEGVKWAAAILLLGLYTLRLQPIKGWYLIRMRWQISGGLTAPQ